MANWQEGRMKLCLMVSILILLIQNVYGTNYYINQVSGSDTGEGTSTETAWRLLANINTTIFYPGDSILMRADQLWVGTLQPQGSGAEGKPIVIGRYGDGSNPVINGAGLTNCTNEAGESHYCTIFLYNQQYWVIEDLEITNYEASEEANLTLSEWEQRNITDYVDMVEPHQYAGSNSKKSGVLVEGKSAGAIKGLTFRNLEIHGINGDIRTKDNGGIFMEIFQGITSSHFEDLLIENCHIHDVDRTGISNWSYYDNREFNSNSNWKPNKSYVIRNCTFVRTGVNALIVRVSDGAVIEQCLFSDCSIKGSGNAAFNFNTDNTLWQFNEFERTKANLDDEDAGGVDSDYRSKNTTIQYNYLHDNDFGLLVTGGPGRFNDRTIIRYNIIEGDGHMARKGSDGKFSVRFSGSATNTYFHNNLVYIPEGQDFTHVIYSKSWSGAKPEDTFFHNNIFYVEGASCEYDLGPSLRNVFSHNLYFGKTTYKTPQDTNAVTEDPQLNAIGMGENSYQLLQSSPARASGLRLESIPKFDFFGNSIAGNISIDIGIHQASNELIESDEVLNTDFSAGALLYPNPVTNNQMWLRTDLQIRSIKIWTLEGILVKQLRLENNEAIDLSNLGDGVYLMEGIDANDTQFSAKFIKR
ncbi:MAG: hypothetical protein ACJA08_000477 [Cyclobacteriaceae bacterium]|jgi:hypothetical protein